MSSKLKVYLFTFPFLYSSKTMLVEDILEFDYPKKVRFKCEKCALCCGDTKDRVRRILLLEIEAKSISQKTHKSVKDFAEKLNGFEPYIYTMKKTEGRKCVFLKDDLCTIYKTRPLICRFYPFELKEDENRKHVFAYTDECPAIGKGPCLEKGYFERLFKTSMKTMKENEENIHV
jgi:Fe-S-cluster containining protein